MWILDMLNCTLTTSFDIMWILVRLLVELVSTCFIEMLNCTLTCHVNTVVILMHLDSLPGHFSFLWKEPRKECGQRWQELSIVHCTLWDLPDLQTKWTPPGHTRTPLIKHYYYYFYVTFSHRIGCAWSSSSLAHWRRSNIKCLMSRSLVFQIVHVTGGSHIVSLPGTIKLQEGHWAVWNGKEDSGGGGEGEVNWEFLRK